MSHVATIQLEFRDPEALAAAARQLGATVSQGRVTFYDRTTVEGTLIHLPGWRYPVAIDRLNRAHYDTWGGRWGDPALLGRLKQAYAVEVAQRTARRLGRQTRRLTLPDGSIRLEISA